jgi:fatty acid-binding protein DegV
MHTSFPNFWLKWPYISQHTISSVILTKSGTGAIGLVLVLVEVF